MTTGMEMVKSSPTTLAKHDTASVAAAAQSKALVEAKFMMALHRQRDMDSVRTKLLKECQRPGFAERSRYSIRRSGKAIEGPSIRFAEAAARAMGNLDISTPVVYEDREQRVIAVNVVDLESNTTQTSNVIVTKVVERKFLRGEQKAISQRQNSQGEVVYLVEASEDDLIMKQAALVSKAMRTNILRIVPQDIVDECMEMAVSTMAKKDAEDPDAARRRLIDAFVAIGVKPVDLKAYVGRDLDALAPAEMQMLRDAYAAIRDGVTTWASVMEGKKEERAAAAGDAKAADGAEKVAGAAGRSGKLKETLKQKAAPKDEAPATESRVEFDASTGEVRPDQEPTDDQLSKS